MHLLAPSLAALAASHNLNINPDSSSGLARRDQTEFNALVKAYNAAIPNVDLEFCFPTLEYTGDGQLDTTNFTPECKAYVDGEGNASTNFWNEFIKDFTGYNIGEEEIQAIGFLVQCKVITTDTHPQQLLKCQQSVPNCGPSTPDGQKVASIIKQTLEVGWEHCPAIVDAILDTWKTGFLWTLKSQRGSVTTVTDEAGTRTTTIMKDNEPMTLTAPSRTIPTELLAFTTAFEGKAPAVTGGSDGGEKGGDKPSGEDNDDKDSAGNTVEVGRMELVGMSAAVLMGIVGMGFL